MSIDAREMNPSAATATGQMLVNANYISVNHRYSEDDAPDHPYTFKRYEKRLTPVQVVKACDCFDYQSCEVDNYESTEAFKLIRHIRWTAIAKLPGYDAADWEITDEAESGLVVIVLSRSEAA